MANCLYCYQPLPEDGQPDFHEHCSLEFFGEKVAPVLPYTLSQMEQLARNVLERSITVPGVQPKISLSLERDKKTTTKQERLTVVGALGGNYIVKPPSGDYPGLPQNEHVTMRIAEEMDIRTVPSSLIRLASGELAYITRRVDRTPDQQKIHMLDMFQITEATDKYRSSMERIGKTLQRYAANIGLDQVRFFELTAFAFLSGNSDMHLKNFSMIVNVEGIWGLAPAYDLLNVRIALPTDTEELALTLNSKKSNLTRDDFDYLGRLCQLTERQLLGVYRRLSAKRAAAEAWLDRSFLSSKSKEQYKDVLAERYARLEGTIGTKKSPVR